MNNRILELAEQAGSTHKQSLGVYQFYREELEEFAELIVQECVGVALEQKQLIEKQEVFNPQDEFWNRARIQQSEHIIEKILEHFNIKS